MMAMMTPTMMAPTIDSTTPSTTFLFSSFLFPDGLLVPVGDPVEVTIVGIIVVDVPVVKVLVGGTTLEFVVVTDGATVDDGVIGGAQKPI